MFQSVYRPAPTLQRDVNALQDALVAQYVSGTPDSREVRRITRRLRFTNGRYMFDHTVPANWIKGGVGLVLLWATWLLLKAVSRTPLQEHTMTIEHIIELFAAGLIAGATLLYVLGRIKTPGYFGLAITAAGLIAVSGLF